MYDAYENGQWLNPRSGFDVQTTSRRSWSFTGSRLRSTPSTTLNMAVVAPIPSASVPIVTTAKPGDLRSNRSPYPRSARRAPMTAPSKNRPHGREIVLCASRPYGSSRGGETNHTPAATMLELRSSHRLHRQPEHLPRLDLVGIGELILVRV